MKKLLVGAAAFGCRRGPSGADKTEIPVEMERSFEKAVHPQSAVGSSTQLEERGRTREKSDL